MQTEIELQPLTRSRNGTNRSELRLERDHATGLWAAATGVAVGWLGSIFFLDKFVGLSFPLFILLLIVAALASTRRAGVSLRIRNLWLILPALFFAMMVAVHADPAITWLNALMAFGLGALWLHHLPLEHPVDESTVMEYASATIESAVGTSFAPFAAIGDTRAWLTQRSPDQSRTALAVARGLLLALPLVLVFAALLSSADAAFGSTLEALWRLMGVDGLDRMFSQALWALFLGWIGCGVAMHAVMRRMPDSGAAAQSDSVEDGVDGESRASQATMIPKRRPVLLSMIESCIVLGSVNLLFGLFVIIQFSYFFGGQSNITIDRLTYAEYARRGFFELVTVAILTLGLVLVLDWITVRTGKRQQTLFRGLSVLMVALTCVMMLSASQRMSLYEAAYGYTHLRVYVHIFIRWLAVLFGFFLLTLFRVRERIFSLGVLVCIVGYGASLNLMNLEAYIAERNIDRYFQGYPLDGGYLAQFSVDAMEPIMALYQRADAAPEVRGLAGNWLRHQYLFLAGLRDGGGNTILSAHLARDQAWLRLQAPGAVPSAYAELEGCCLFASPFETKR